MKISLLLLLATLSVHAEEPALREAAECRARGGLPNVEAKARAGGAIRVGYLGGSITAAPGWRPKSLAWLKARYPSATFSEINAAIGGTGSDLGVFRFRQDVLEHNPDLLFVEFAVNDGGAAPERIHRAMEGIVRQAWTADPATDICFVYTVSEPFLQDLQAGRCSRAATAMEEVADHYAIPSIHLGLESARMAADGRLVFKGKKPAPGEAGPMVFSEDGVHPLVETGHELYLKAIERSWPALAEAGKPGPHALPTPLRADNWERAKLVPVTRAMLSGAWQELDPASDPQAKGFRNRMPAMWKASEPGAKLAFSFTGETAAIYDLLGPDGGLLSVKLDDQPARQVARIDGYCTYHRLARLEIGAGLGEGPHRVEIELLPDSPDKAAILFEHNRPDRDKNPAKYAPNVWRLSSIMLIGDVVVEGAGATLDEDGYALYAKACRTHKLLSPALDTTQLSTALRGMAKGEDPGLDPAELSSREKPVFELLRKAVKTTHWSLPNISTNDTNTMSLDAGAWPQINYIGMIQAVRLMSSGQSAEAMELLVMLNEASLRSAPVHNIIDCLTHFKSRELHRLVLAKLADTMPASDLADNFARAKAQYVLHRPLREVLMEPGYEVTNNAHKVFADLRADRNLLNAQASFVLKFQRLGVDPDLLKRIQNEEVLSVRQWEERAMRDLDMVFGDHLRDVTSPDMQRVSDADRLLDLRVEGLPRVEPQATAVAAWQILLQSFATNQFPLAEAEAAHATVGAGISREILETLPALGGVAIVWHEELAYEKLLLIRMAARLYEIKHGSPPGGLDHLVRDGWLEEGMIVDPISGKPFLLRTTTPFTPYGVGRDLRDDGGVPRKKSKDSGDLVTETWPPSWR